MSFKTKLVTTVAIGSLVALVGCGGTLEDDPRGSSSSSLAAASPSIVELALAANAEGGDYEGLFDTLIAGLLAADPSIIEKLSNKGQYTVFAPTDDAFGKLGLTPDTIGELDKKLLADVLLYHVANGRRYAADVLDADRIRTLQKGFVFPSSDGTLTDNLGNTGKILVTDVEATNGVIHAIDLVVLPYAP